MKRFCTLSLYAALATCVLPTCALAQGTPVLQYSSGLPTSTGTGTFSAGWEFNVNNSITVVALDDSFETPGNQVRLYNSSGLIASATPTDSDPLVGTPGFYAHSIAPVVLHPGTYFIAEDIGEYSIMRTQSLGVATIPSVTYVGLVDELGLGQDPDGPLYLGTSFDPGMFGPNFDIASHQSSTPEPGATALALSSLIAGIGAMVRRRRSKAAIAQEKRSLALS